MPNLRNESIGGEQPQRRTDLMKDFEIRSDSYICKRCHAMVPIQSGHAEGHREWHEALGG